MTFAVDSALRNQLSIYSHSTPHYSPPVVTDPRLQAVGPHWGVFKAIHVHRDGDLPQKVIAAKAVTVPHGHPQGSVLQFPLRYVVLLKKNNHCHWTSSNKEHLKWHKQEWYRQLQVKQMYSFVGNVLVSHRFEPWFVCFLIFFFSITTTCEMNKNKQNKLSPTFLWKKTCYPLVQHPKAGGCWTD